MPQLDPTWFISQLFWLAIVFTVLHVILSRWVLPPLQDTVAKRQQSITGDIAEAESMKTQASEARTQYERTLAEARANAQKLIADVMQTQKTRADQAAAELEKKVEKQLAEASRSISAKKAELITALTPTSEELAGLIVEKLTNQAPGSEAVKRAVKQRAKG